jgi:PAS domain-containing protein
MQDEGKTKEQLIIELQELREQIAESEKDKDERKRHEDAQREAEEQLKFILDKVPALIWQKNREGKYLQVNKAYCDTVGLSADTIVGKTDYDIFPAEIADRYVRDDRKILSSSTSVFDR